MMEKINLGISPAMIKACMEQDLEAKGLSLEARWQRESESLLRALPEALQVRFGLAGEGLERIRRG